MSKKKLAHYACHDMSSFWPASFVKFPWRYWTEFIQSWKDLRKTIRSHENHWSLTDLSGANTAFHSNSRDSLFWIFMMLKVNQLMSKSVLFWQDSWAIFSIFIKNSRNAIPKYEHIIGPHVLSISTFTTIV